MAAQKKKNVKVRDLKPKKDAKGGGRYHITSGTGGRGSAGKSGGGAQPQGFSSGR